MANGEFSVKIPFDRSTAGTHLYKFPGFNRDAVIQNVYISKQAFEQSQPPKEVEVIVRYTY